MAEITWKVLFIEGDRSTATNANGDSEVMREAEIGIARRILESHLRTLWWWQRSRVLGCVTECLECYLHGNEARFYEIINQMRGNPKRVLLLCLRDALKYVEFTGDQLLDAMERFK